MNRARNLRHRRHSLPATSSLSPFGSIRIPGGSDTFQKALEELYSNEPNHAPSRISTGTGPTGLNNIVEGNESDYAESEEDEVAKNESNQNGAMVKGRRHSSPSFLPRDTPDGRFPNAAAVRNLQKSLLKSHSQYRKEYFIKHGHYPSSSTINKPTTPRIPSRQKSIHERPNASQEVAFGTSTTVLTSTMAKLRV